jgi:hypothetical protein
MFTAFLTARWADGRKAKSIARRTSALRTEYPLILPTTLAPFVPGINNVDRPATILCHLREFYICIHAYDPYG